MQLVRMNIVATRDLDDRTLSHQAFLNDPHLLSRCPPPAPLRAGKYRHSHRVCPLICKSMGKPVTSTANPIGGLHRMHRMRTDNEHRRAVRELIHEAFHKANE